MALSRDAIFQSKDLDKVRLDIPEWEGYVYVRVMSGYERDKFEQEVLAAREKTGMPPNIRSKLAVMLCVDDDGNQIFNASDIDDLGKKSASALQRIFDTALDKNSFSESDVKDLEGN